MEERKRNDVQNAKGERRKMEDGKRNNGKMQIEKEEKCKIEKGKWNLEKEK